MKIFFIAMLCCLLTGWCSYAQAELLTYQVYLDQKAPLQGKVVVDTSGLGLFELLPARSFYQNQSQNTVPLIVCDTQPGIKADKPLELRCDQISWELTFKTLTDTAGNITQQENLFFPKPQPWWLLYEWGNFPRFTSKGQARVCLNDGRLNRCKPLPNSDQPPLIIASGSPVAEYKLAHLEVSLYGEFEARQTQVLPVYDEIIAYLVSVFPNDGARKKWDLVWLPREKASGSIGGVAGHNIFIANYPVENGGWQEQSEEWLLRISAHEAIHIMSKLDIPAWAEESLAEYYAFKATKKLGIATDNPLLSLQKSLPKLPQPQASKGLYRAQEQVSKHKDMSYYPLFYLKGAAFWYEIDKALQKKGQTLDRHIKQLEGLTFQEGELPLKFEDSLKEAISTPVWEIIKKTYLLDQGSDPPLKSSNVTPVPIKERDEDIVH